MDDDKTGLMVWPGKQDNSSAGSVCYVTQKVNSSTIQHHHIIMII